MDYDKVGDRYREGRAEPQRDLDALWDAVEPFIPTQRPLTVLDVGAGTGIFTRAWPQWCDCQVVAVEPSSGMRATAASTGIPPEAAMLAGVGEAVPLRSASVHVAWLSTVLHHLRDRHGCVAELRRVVTGGGVVFVRGLFADLGHVGWLRFFPDADALRATFLSAADTATLFADHGFGLTVGVEVDTRVDVTARDVAVWARRMRNADTLLGAFGDAEFEGGVAALESYRSNEPLGSRLGLLAFVRP